MNEATRAQIGAKLREAREYLGISQEEASRKTNISRSAISLIESGRRKLDSVELSALARLYQQPVSYFIGDIDPSEVSNDISILARSYSQLSDQDRQELVRFAEFLALRAKGES